jgi:FtsZ-binding cell division protein ZapB
MKVKRIGFGYVKNLGGFENCRVYMEAELEDWENPSESLDLLRTQVAEDLNLPDKWRDLKNKTYRQEQALEITNAALTAAEEKLKKAQKNWDDFAQSLIARGINSELVNKNPFDAIKETIARQIDEAAEYMLPTLHPKPEEATHLDAEQDLPPLGEGYDPDYYDPYHEPENEDDDWD